VGVGSGKVLESGPDDNVFIFFTDHGAAGLVAFPTGVLYAKDFNTAIKKCTQIKNINRWLSTSKHVNLVQCWKVY